MWIKFIYGKVVFKRLKLYIWRVGIVIAIFECQWFCGLQRLVVRGFRLGSVLVWGGWYCGIGVKCDLCFRIFQFFLQDNRFSQRSRIRQVKVLRFLVSWYICGFNYLLDWRSVFFGVDCRLRELFQGLGDVIGRQVDFL